MQIRNYNRKRTTDNRFVIDSNSYWKEELHPRVEYLRNDISVKVDNKIQLNLSQKVWGFPVDEQTTSNAFEVLGFFTEQYLDMVNNRRLWVYTETDGYWTEQKIAEAYSAGLIAHMWDIVQDLLIKYYPLVADDLRLRSGKTATSDKRETYHDSVSKVDTADKTYTQHDNTRNKIAEQTDNSGSDTTNSRSTNNATTINDVFLSPQNQGVKPSSQSNLVMNHGGGFESPENHGVAEVTPNGNAGFTTSTSNVFEGSTDTVAEGRTSTNKTGHSRVDERDYLEGNATFETGTAGENNLGARTANDNEVERYETLDIVGVLKNFKDLYSDTLMLELDNRMLPYYLNMKISRFKDHRIGREYYK